MSHSLLINERNYFFAGLFSLKLVGIVSRILEIETKIHGRAGFLFSVAKTLWASLAYLFLVPKTGKISESRIFLCVLSNPCGAIMTTGYFKRSCAFIFSNALWVVLLQRMLVVPAHANRAQLKMWSRLVVDRTLWALSLKRSTLPAPKIPRRCTLQCVLSTFRCGLKRIR